MSANFKYSPLSTFKHAEQLPTIAFRHDSQTYIYIHELVKRCDPPKTTRQSTRSLRTGLLSAVFKNFVSRVLHLQQTTDVADGGENDEPDAQQLAKVYKTQRNNKNQHLAQGNRNCTHAHTKCRTKASAQSARSQRTTLGMPHAVKRCHHRSGDVFPAARTRLIRALGVIVFAVNQPTNHTTSKDTIVLDVYQRIKQPTHGEALRNAVCM